MLLRVRSFIVTRSLIRTTPCILRLPQHFYISRNSTMAPGAAEASPAYLASIDLSNYDPEQSRLMDERCILVDEQDHALGAADKKTCMSKVAHF